MAWDRKAPFSASGNLMHYPGWQLDEVDWRPVADFKATMKYSRFQRGRSAAYFIFEDDKGHRYPMFLADVDKIIPILKQGQLSGTWTITKRGMNFGLQFVP